MLALVAAAVLSSACEIESGLVGARLPFAVLTPGVQAPRRLVHVVPNLPPYHGRVRTSESWTLEALVDEEGAVRNVRVVKEPNVVPLRQLFTDPIASAVRQWKYSPTVIDGKPVPVCLTVTAKILFR